MKKLTTLLVMLGVTSIFVIPQAKVSADAYASTSIIDQIEHPDKGETLNHNGARNWLMDGKNYSIQATKNGEIYYRIASTDPYYQKIWNDAIQGWNNLGVIKLVPVTSGEAILLTGNENSKPNSDWYGNDSSDTLVDSSTPGFEYFMHTKLTLAGKLDQAKKFYSLNLHIAEHEIGHALGFAHDNSKNHGYYHIMHDGTGPALDRIVKPLGNYEKQTLLKYYQPGQTRNPNE